MAEEKAAPLTYRTTRTRRRGVQMVLWAVGYTAVIGTIAWWENDVENLALTLLKLGVPTLITGALIARPWALVLPLVSWLLFALAVGLACSLREEFCGHDGGIGGLALIAIWFVVPLTPVVAAGWGIGVVLRRRVGQRRLHGGPGSTAITANDEGPSGSRVALGRAIGIAAWLLSAYVLTFIALYVAFGDDWSFQGSPLSPFANVVQLLLAGGSFVMANLAIALASTAGHQHRSLPLGVLSLVALAAWGLLLRTAGGAG